MLTWNSYLSSCIWSSWMLFLIVTLSLLFSVSSLSLLLQGHILLFIEDIVEAISVQCLVLWVKGFGNRARGINYSCTEFSNFTVIWVPGKRELSGKEWFFSFFSPPPPPPSPEAYRKTGEKNEQEFHLRFFFSSNWIMKEFSQSERPFMEQVLSRWIQVFRRCIQRY